MTFLHGDRIAIRQDSEFAYQAQDDTGKYRYGTILVDGPQHSDEQGTWWKVVWDHWANQPGATLWNQYPEKDLRLVYEPVFQQDFDLMDLEQVKEEFGL